MAATVKTVVRRADKTRAVVRYLISRTGIPLISWDGIGNRIDAPPPYGFVVSTDSANWRLVDGVKHTDDARIEAVVRYDKFIDSIDDAIVAMKLSTFVKLLESHYSSISDRVDTYAKGD